MTEDVMVAWYHRLDGREFGQDSKVGDRQGGLVFCNPHVHKESGMTKQLN